MARNDSLWGIAEELLGDGTRWREIVDANVGREISPGVVFDRDTEAIQPGWELLVPVRDAAQTNRIDRCGRAGGAGDTLASIAADRYGDAAAWSTLWEANAGRDFGGRLFDDPDLIMPGWDLLVPEDPSLVVLEPVDPVSQLSATTAYPTGSHADVVNAVATAVPPVDTSAAPLFAPPAPVAPPVPVAPALVPASGA